MASCDCNPFNARRAAAWTALVAVAAAGALLWFERSKPTVLPEEEACAGSSLAVTLRPVAWDEPRLQPSEQVDRVFKALQYDLMLHVFAAPALQLQVTPREDWQAGAGADGTVELSRGLMDAMLTDDELYAVLAHEAFHVVHRDGNYRSCGHDLESRHTQTVLQSQEMAADRAAQELLVKVGRDPLALQTVLDKLRVRDGDAGGSTHPGMQTRLRALRGLAQT